MCTGAQVREARRLLGWSADRLGAQCDTGGGVILKFEKTEVLAPPSVQKNPENLNVDRLGLIRGVLEAAGVVFSDGEGPGVKLGNAAGGSGTMTEWAFEGPARRCGEEASEGALPHPAMMVEVTAQELEALIVHHNDCAQVCGARHEHGAEAFHLARATCLLQWLAQMAPGRVSPGRTGPE